MHRPSPTLLAACIALAVSPCQEAAATGAAGSSAWRACAAEAAFSWQAPLRPPEDPDPAIELRSSRVDVSGRDVYRFEGEVELNQPGRRLAAQRIDYTHSTGAYRAQGEVRYQDPRLAVEAVRAEGNVRQRTGTLDQVHYRLVEARGHGSAEQARLDGPLATLSAVDYTTCDPGTQGWRIRAHRLEVDREEGLGVARGATLEIGKVPVLWVPWLAFPVDERRRTGLLFPSLGYADETGIDLRVPLYLNLAPNMDATLTPRVLGRRGVMLGTEFRYLTAQHSGRIEASWLPDDDLAGRDRGSFRLRHHGRLAPEWSVLADLNHVSDDRYFEDFGDSLTARSTSLLESNAGLVGRGPGWYAQLLARDFQITDPLVSDQAEPYRQVPRLRFGLDRDLGLHARYGIDAELVRFDHEAAGAASGYQRGAATRQDLQPWFELGFERAAGYLRPRLAFRHTAYRLGEDWLRGPADCPPGGCSVPPARFWPDRSPSRSLPITSLDAALNFERPTRLFGQPMLQTLQPRLFYLRVPYEDQGDLPLFDTQELTFGWDQLFRTNRFSGADRQADANQVTLALSSRWFEASSGRERLALGLGQIRYLDPPRVGLDLPPPPADQSAYVATADLRLGDTLSLGLGQQWDPELRRTTVQGTRLQWRGTEGRVANLGYRYRRGELEQIDGSLAMPVAEQWRWIGRWNYSLRDRSTLEALAGLEWQGCCVAVRVLGRHYVRNREGDKNNALYVEIELKGLASLGRDTEEFLQRAILGYSR
ncbi:MAG: LPS-assembly protein LptD [Lysobacteraceae bacterium]|nr:MAG: LPS-assembly protein LptD [Xanthomonadaceae bacterium]